MSDKNTRLLKLKQKKLELLEKEKLVLIEQEKQIRFELPHLYCNPFYPWQRDYFDSKNKMNILCAANQIGKSSINIRKLVANATDPARMLQRAPARMQYRMQFYLYPDSKTLNREWNTKWVDFMPRGSMKMHPQYGWSTENDRDRKVPYCINWFSGVTTYFMYYSKDVSSIQASSPNEIFCDEELPMGFYDELIFRLTATEGTFNMVYTPTLNQMFWKRVMQKKVLKEAFAKEISAYDCLVYEDGSPSTAFTREKIKEMELKCSSEAEIQRRIYGKHIAESGRLYYGYEEERNVTQNPVSFANYHFYAGLDYGSGGMEGHPAAIVFIAVAPDLCSGYVFRVWRGDNIQTTAGDVVNKYTELRDVLSITDTVYDHSAKDMETIALRSGLPINKANKSRDVGIELVNTLFLSGALKVIDYGDESQSNREQLKLMEELSMVMVDQRLNDDLCDALRYVCCAVPWNYEEIKKKLPSNKSSEEIKTKVQKPLTEKELIELQIRERRGEDVYGERKQDDWQEFYDEIDEFNGYYEV